MNPKRPYGKRTIPVSVKFSAEEKAAYEEVGIEKDRPFSYVMRELALRGLVEYRKDGIMRPSDEEISAALALKVNPSSRKKFGNG